MIVDYYVVLQLDPSADPDVVEAAYKRLARKFHPDVSHEPDAESRMRALNEAFGVLGSVSRREDYDRRRLIRIRAEYVATRDARDQSPNARDSTNSPDRPTASDFRGAQGATPTTAADKATAVRASSKRRPRSTGPRMGHKHVREVPGGDPEADSRATERARTHALARHPRKIRTVISRLAVVKLIDLAARALETLRFHVKRSGMSTSRRLLGVRIGEMPASRLPISTWHAGVVAFVGLAIFGTMGIGSVIAEIFQPNAQLRSTEVVESRLVIVNSKALAVSTQIVMRRPVATPDVWPPIMLVEPRASEEITSPIHFDSGARPVVDVERTLEVRTLGVVPPSDLASTVDVQPIRPAPRGMLDLLRSAATALENRSLCPRRPVPPVAPGIPMGQ